MESEIENELNNELSRKVETNLGKLTKMTEKSMAKFNVSNMLSVPFYTCFSKGYDDGECVENDEVNVVNHVP